MYGWPVLIYLAAMNGCDAKACSGWGIRRSAALSTVRCSAAPDPATVQRYCRGDLSGRLGRDALPPAAIAGRAVARFYRSTGTQPTGTRGAFMAVRPVDLQLPTAQPKPHEHANSEVKVYLDITW